VEGGGAGGFYGGPRRGVLKRAFKRLNGTQLNTVRYGTLLSFSLLTVRRLVTFFDLRYLFRRRFKNDLESKITYLIIMVLNNSTVRYGSGIDYLLRMRIILQY
jgi:hypothetical protein